MISHRDNIPLEKRYDYGRYVVKTYVKPCRIYVKAFGLSNLPEKQGYVMFPNHQGKYDIMGLFLTHPTPTSYIMDRDRSHFLMISELLDIVGGKRLDLNDVRQNLTVINEVAGEVKEGTNYIIFAEGAYDKKKRNKVYTFKPGSFKAATKVHAPIVPVCLIDTYKPFNSFAVGPVYTQVHFLEPLYYDDYRSMKSTEIAAKVRDRIINKMLECGIDPY